MKKYFYQNKIEAYSGIKHPTDEGTFRCMKCAYEFILKISWIEDKYSILLDNFYEFHKEIYPYPTKTHPEQLTDKYRHFSGAKSRLWEFCEKNI